MPSLCDCFGRVGGAQQDAYKADGPGSDGLPRQMSIPAPKSTAAEGHKDSVEELGATREAARQQREEKEAAKSKKDKASADQEGAGAVASGVADSGVPTVVVINAGDDEKEAGGGLDAEQVHPEIVEKEDTTEQPSTDEAEAAEAGSAAAAAAAAAVEAVADVEAGEAAEGDRAVLQDLSAQVLKECVATGGAESAERLAEFVGSLASGAAESACSALEHFGPVGPLFKCLGMCMNFAGRVKGARGEGQRLLTWG